MNKPKIDLKDLLAKADVKGHAKEVFTEHNVLLARTKLLRLVVNIVKYVLVFGLCFVILLPLFQQFMLGFRSFEDINDVSVVWIPNTWSIESFRIGWFLLDYVDALRNTILMSVLVTIGQLISTALAGYAFARLRFPGNNILFILVIATIVIPPQTIILPQFIYFSNFDVLGIFELIRGEPLNLISNVSSIVILSFFGMGINSGLFIYIFRQFFRGLPRELEESAEIDGANVVTIFARIMLPNARGALITVGLFSFVWQWNDTFYTKLFQINSPDFPILTQRLLNTVDNIRGLSNSVLTTMISETVADNPELLTVLTSTAALLVMLPILIIYIFVQKHFVEGIERTGIVG